jgi:hypothetical protein
MSVGDYSENYSSEEEIISPLSTSCTDLWKLGLALSSLNHLYLGVESNKIYWILYWNALLIVLLQPPSRHEGCLENKITWHVIP